MPFATGRIGLRMVFTVAFLSLPDIDPLLEIFSK